MIKQCAFCGETGQCLDYIVADGEGRRRGIWMCTLDAPMLARYDTICVWLDDSWQVMGTRRIW